jgi:hypothetical protein
VELGPASYRERPDVQWQFCANGGLCGLWGGIPGLPTPNASSQFVGDGCKFILSEAQANVYISVD